MTPDEARKRMRSHAVAFGAILLLALTAPATVLTGRSNPAIVMVIAAVQVFVVLAAMMHAPKDGPWVRGLLAFCALFVAALAGLTLLGLKDTVAGTEKVVVSAPGPAADAGDTH
jgi:heme/copper-type cytochrome/quinol oxidase subunit 4